MAAGANSAYADRIKLPGSVEDNLTPAVRKSRRVRGHPVHADTLKNWDDLLDHARHERAPGYAREGHVVGRLIIDLETEMAERPTDSEVCMAVPVRLHGYRYSLYNRIARLALLSKNVEHETIEVNPFAELSKAYLMQHPFGRVPLLTHGTFELFETSAITRDVDRAFDGPPLQPERAVALARMDQVIAVIDAYAYWPMVRQVSSQAFFRPLLGEPSDREEVDLGLEASRKVLSFLDRIAGEGVVGAGLCPGRSKGD